MAILCFFQLGDGLEAHLFTNSNEPNQGGQMLLAFFKCNIPLNKLIFLFLFLFLDKQEAETCAYH